ncbi:S-adenosyl-L-methionine-dependent methyltransferase [Guyanagaster necrorhizus]|uniref:DNA (cytosine-5-)-methyltransferase n=1 Tax=Guyanagaster necrorhizus TaxID=856835 RepID=A0A9P7W3S5_9AGAR|nr:S-adenosyl-L-methionine-dependent methyltransferase [Guyanagaster necrorhizus MCA 3950]KAG7452102.1 S-adenosyl-L-methionine-dependent methyltransferase [Guyanagaster necrorhizus MCA 3950]
MSWRANRPNALDVSFPEEAAALRREEEARLTTKFAPTLQTLKKPANANPHKRKGDERQPLVHVQGAPRAPRNAEAPPAKRRKRNLAPIEIPVYFEPPIGIQAFEETRRLVLPGEDPDEIDNELKIIRYLTNFAFYDDNNNNAFVPLSLMEENDGVTRHFRASGFVRPSFVNDEDEGQEDGIDDDTYLHLGSIMTFSFDYTKKDSPVYLETEYSWYRLERPSPRYQPFFERFLVPRRIAQLVVSSAVARPPPASRSEFIRLLEDENDNFGSKLTRDDLTDSLSQIEEALDEHERGEQLRHLPFVRAILPRVDVSAAKRKRKAKRHRLDHRPPEIPERAGLDLDTIVLKPENQTPTHVTGAIANLAKGLFSEELHVCKAPPPPVDEEKKLQEQQENRNYLEVLIGRANRHHKKTDWRRDQRLSSSSRYLKSVSIDGVTICIDDDIVVLPDENRECFPETIEAVKFGNGIAHYFWFARVLFIDFESEMAHVLWYDHGSNTVLEELAHPQELFILDLCTSIPLLSICGTVKVHRWPKEPVPLSDFYCRFKYDKATAAFVDPDLEASEMASTLQPPNNCPSCLCRDQRDQEKSAVKIADGIACSGNHYHIDDFVLYASPSGPAAIGQIIDIKASDRITASSQPTVSVRPVGRISDLGILPRSEIRDERHVFLTNSERMISVDVTDLLRVCFVFSYTSITDEEAWLAMSPDHFYVKYSFPSLKVASWDAKTVINPVHVPICKSCTALELERFKNIKDIQERVKLPTLDIFGGVGAFALGMAKGCGNMDITHSIEIAPSAAKTYKRNSPRTIVYNQCANTMLKYMVKHHHRPGQMDPPLQIYDETPVPLPPSPGQIKVVVAGFPCQSHSALNMYKHEHDKKSNLILTTLSMMDFLRPDYGFFENVPGFINYRPDATQFGRHKLQGGMEQGGLKFVLHALLDMKYQVRFGLMDAAHYGAPQRRKRFFICAAQQKLKLSSLPQPTHDFPNTEKLAIKLSVGGSITPIRTTNGTAPHRCVTIGDAISDLPRYDYKHPIPGKRVDRGIKSLFCKSTDAHCGYEGRTPYHHAPLTRYQKEARKNATENIQHFTRPLKEKIVERIVNIPLKAGADYRSLPGDLHEYQTVNPRSANARTGFRSGMYGRLDAKDVFPTTVTNVYVTAKQSRVLNPWCHRMVTVRELARSQGFRDDFVFESLYNNVVTIHRQIGNAVPWPVATALGRELQAVVLEDPKYKIINIV